MKKIINLKTLKLSELAVLFGLIAIGCLGAWIAGYSMRWGPWALSDSVGYVEVAHNLIVGNGPVQIKGSGGIELLTTRPPFYSMILALLSLSGLPIIDSARILNIILFFLFTSGIGLFINRFTYQAGLALLSSLFILSAPVMILNFTGAMSEPLFFCLGFLGIFLTFTALENQRKGLLWLAAAFSGLAFVSRFTGVTMLAAGSILVLLFSKKPFQKRIWDCAVYFILGLIPFIIWTLYLRFMGSYPGEYAIPSYQEMITLLRGGIRSITEIAVGWLPWGNQLGTRFPNHHAIFLAILGLSALLILLLTLFKGGKQTRIAAWNKPNFQLGVGLGIFNLVYIFFLLATYLFVKNPKPVLDVRMLSPLLIGGVLCAVGFLDFIFEENHSKLPRQIIPAVLILIFIIANVSPSIRYIQAMHFEGSGYTSKAWQESSLIAAIRQIPPSDHIISDNIDVIMLYTFRSASRIPELESKTPQPLEQPFGGNQADWAQAMFRNGKAALVLFKAAYWQFDSIYGGQGETQTRFDAFTRGLYAAFTNVDGSIYYYTAPK